MGKHYVNVTKFIDQTGNVYFELILNSDQHQKPKMFNLFDPKGTRLTDEYFLRQINSILAEWSISYDISEGDDLKFTFNEKVFSEMRYRKARKTESITSEDIDIFFKVQIHYCAISH